jgi:hypothetical protein
MPMPLKAAITLKYQSLIKFTYFWRLYLLQPVCQKVAGIRCQVSGKKTKGETFIRAET